MSASDAWLRLIGFCTHNHYAVIQVDLQDGAPIVEDEGYPPFQGQLSRAWQHCIQLCQKLSAVQLTIQSGDLVLMRYTAKSPVSGMAEVTIKP